MNVKVAIAIAVTVTAAVILSSFLRDEADPTSEKPAQVILTPAGAPSFSQRPLTERELKRRRRAILRATREFVEVYRRYQLGDFTRRLRQQLQALTTRSFARALEQQPARAPKASRPEDSRTLGITLYGDPSRKTVSVEVRSAYKRDGQTFRSVMFATLERQGQSWRVSGIR